MSDIILLVFARVKTPVYDTILFLGCEDIMEKFKAFCKRKNIEVSAKRYGIDALLCGTIDDTERTAVGMAGIMLFPGYSGKADDAALRFLSGSVVSDPNNHCNACGVKGACSLKDKGGCGGN